MRNRVQLTGDIFFRFVIDVSFNDADDDDADDDDVDDVIAAFTTASASTDDTSLLRGILTNYVQTCHSDILDVFSSTV